MGGHIVSQDDAQSPGSDGASPYQRRGLLCYLAYDLLPHRIVDQWTQEFIGVILQVEMTRKAPVRTEPHPTSGELWKFQKCVRRGSNPQPSAPEADALSS
jgi:hypothetical protein